MICETGKLYAGSERVRELWKRRVVTSETIEEEAIGTGIGESGIQKETDMQLMNRYKELIAERK